MSSLGKKEVEQPRHSDPPGQGGLGDVHLGRAYLILQTGGGIGVHSKP